MADRSTLFVVAISGASFVYRSADGGKTWTTAFGGVGGADLHDLAFSGSGIGRFVYGNPSAISGAPRGRLIVSTDAGASWNEVSLEP